MSDKLFTCPYDAAHVMKMTRAHSHIITCREKYSHKNYVICSYNALHHYPPEKAAEHLAVCAERLAIIDGNHIQFRAEPHSKGNLTMPPAPKIVPLDEEWDD